MDSVDRIGAPARPDAAPPVRNVRGGAIAVALDVLAPMLRALLPMMPPIVDLAAVAPHAEDAFGAERATLAQYFGEPGQWPLAREAHAEVSDRALAVVSLLLRLRPLGSDFAKGEAPSVALVIKRETEAIHKLRRRRSGRSTT